MKEQLALLPGYLVAHLQLTLVALTLGVGLSVPLGIALSRSRRLEAPVLAVASIIQTIPSLALLAFMVPALAALGLKSIGFAPAIVGLFLYSVLPILRNTVAGLAAVDPALREAARGVGMTPGEQLRRVELPLAMPVIVAGIRTSAVWTVGTATLSTPVGAPSLGNYIFSGLQTRNYTAVLVGCIAAAALALLLDTLVRALEAGIRRRSRALVGTSLAALGALGVIAAGSFVASAAAARSEGDRISIGAKTFTEQYILSRILAGAIARETGLPTEAVDSLGSTVAFDALRNGQIDGYVEYTGTLWTTIMKRSEIPGDRAALLREVDDYLRAEHGIVVAAALGFENTYTIAVRRADATRLALRTVGDLAPHLGAMSLGGDYEIFQRPEWRSLQRAYGLAPREQRSMDPSLMYEAIRARQVDAITAFSTDGRLVSYDLQALDDDRHAIPPYDAIVLVSARTAREHGDVVTALRGLAGSIDADRMRRMNAAVDEQGDTPATVAERFLRERLP
ncbi:ABC transporter permease/substrate-binding protein [Chondromyces apiculatus]|uniref:L-proline glycine betaine binding ABC transporter protein ProX n=1 Tax=Chondromyces apiculatus DSM 436 TaxID=1192034 RepID=A0A017T3W5_9BACT|nr:ABC transporter permease/substrate-binding protein [Chondromyces apiculatus]EYF03939.1 L-proline glycine betaine binding ABC transporter protein ProX [Chondromyces apiculatus DSM 436]